MMSLCSGRPETGPLRVAVNRPRVDASPIPSGMCGEQPTRTTIVGGTNVTFTPWPDPAPVRRRNVVLHSLAFRRLVPGLLVGLVLICATHPSPAAARGGLAAPSGSWLKACCRTLGHARVLTLWGVAPRGGAYLGCSFCPVGTRDVARDGIHRVFVVHAGFVVNLPIPLRASGGRYEAALWLHKVPAARCTIPHCEWCRRDGYHLATMLAWSSGSLR